MVRFLHTSDWQIGRKFSSFSDEDSTALSEARIETVERIAALATERALDAILVAGDVFDAQTVSDRTIHRLFNALKGFTRPWILIPGNHDAALAESVWTRAKRLGCIPSQVDLIEAVECRSYPEIGLAVLAAPLSQRQTNEDLTASFDSMETAQGLVRVGLAHGSIQGIIPEEACAGNPIAADRENTARLDYFALGDWHGTKQVASKTWYSGTHERDRFKGNEPGYVLEIDVAAGSQPQVIRHRSGKFDWSEFGEELRLTTDLDRLEDKLGGFEKTDVIRLDLAGRIDFSCLERLERMLGQVHGRTRSFEVDRSRLQFAPTPEDLQALSVDGYLGEVVQDLRNRTEGLGTPEEAKLASQALLELASVLRGQRSQEARA